MRGYVERMEMLAYSMPEGVEPDHDTIMESFRDDVDHAMNEHKDKLSREATSEQENQVSSPQ